MADIETNVAVDPQVDANAAFIHEQMVERGYATAPEVTDPAIVVPGAEVKPVDIPFTFDTFKEKFGYQKPEDAMAEIEQLRAFKAAPPVTAAKFENDFSKNIHDLLAAGKTKEVYEHLDKQFKIERLATIAEPDESSAAEIVKYGMAEKYKNLKPSEIEYKFRKDFGVPAKPVKAPDEEDDSYKARVADWQGVVDDKKMDLIIAAKQLQPEIESSKAKLVLSPIEQAADQDYLNYKKSVEDYSKQSAATAAAYKAITAATAETKFAFVDKANKVEVPFQHVPDAVSFAQVQDLVADDVKFNKFFTKADGSSDREKFFKVIYNGLNTEKMLTQAMVDTMNATLKSMLPDNEQSSGLVRQLNQVPVEKTELQKQMEGAGIARVI